MHIGIWICSVCAYRNVGTVTHHNTLETGYANPAVQSHLLVCKRARVRARAHTHTHRWTTPGELGPPPSRGRGLWGGWVHPRTHMHTKHTHMHHTHTHSPSCMHAFPHMHTEVHTIQARDCIQNFILLRRVSQQLYTYMCMHAVRHAATYRATHTPTPSFCSGLCRSSSTVHTYMHIAHLHAYIHTRAHTHSHVPTASFCSGL